MQDAVRALYNIANRGAPAATSRVPLKTVVAAPAGRKQSELRHSLTL